MSAVLKVFQKQRRKAEISRVKFPLCYFAYVTFDKVIDFTPNRVIYSDKLVRFCALSDFFKTDI